MTEKKPAGVGRVGMEVFHVEYTSKICLMFSFFVDRCLVDAPISPPFFRKRSVCEQCLSSHYGFL